MAGYSIKRKKEQGQYPANLTEQAWSIEDLLYGLLRDHRGKSRAGKDRPTLPARVANKNTGFASSCPLAEPAI